MSRLENPRSAASNLQPLRTESSIRLEGLIDGDVRFPFVKNAQGLFQFPQDQLYCCDSRVAVLVSDPEVRVTVLRRWDLDPKDKSALSAGATAKSLEQTGTTAAEEKTAREAKSSTDATATETTTQRGSTEKTRMVDLMSLGSSTGTPTVPKPTPFEVTASSPNISVPQSQSHTAKETTVNFSTSTSTMKASATSSPPETPKLTERPRIKVMAKEGITTSLKTSEKVTSSRMGNIHAVTTGSGEPTLEDALKNFVIYSRSTAFLTSDVEKVLAMLRDDRLCLRSEKDAFRAVNEWILYDPAARKNEAARLMSAVRFSLMNLEDLLRVVHRSRYLLTVGEYRDSLLEAFIWRSACHCGVSEHFLDFQPTMRSYEWSFNQCPSPGPAETNSCCSTCPCQQLNYSSIGKIGATCSRDVGCRGRCP